MGRDSEARAHAARVLTESSAGPMTKVEVRKRLTEIRRAVLAAERALKAGDGTLLYVSMRTCAETAGPVEAALKWGNGWDHVEGMSPVEWEA